jgi:hypothetical protein
MKFNAIIFSFITALTLSACDEDSHRPPTTDELRAQALADSAKNAKLQELLEQQRSTALGNVSANAASYFASNPRFDSSWKVIPHTDDYIGPACPQGSGWAWASVMKVEGKNVEKKRIYCSTSSSSVGCYIEDDFTKSPYAAQATKCDSNLPHPLKPISR